MSISSSAVPFEWRDHLGLAEELAQRDDETALRTVVYLSYYAIYNTVVAHLLLHGAHVDGDNHIAAWDLLNHGKGSKPQLVKRGHYLRKLRNKVSY